MTVIGERATTPADKGRPMTAASMEGADGLASAPINILIVDDEPANLLVLETVLDDPGYRLVRANSGSEALLALMEDEFAVLVLDIRLPDMTGFELAAAIKQRKKTAGVPMIFLTAYYDQDQHALAGYETGAVDYLNKPVNPAVLKSKVAVFAELHRKKRAIAQANVALSQEVGERRRAEEQLRELNDTLEQRVVERTEALRQADQKLQTMMSSITDGLLMLDRQWHFTYCNEQGARLLGKQVQDLLGTSVWDLFSSNQALPFEEGFRRAVQTRQTVSFEALYPDAAGRWFECHCYPLDGTLSVYFHDVSDRREVEFRREQLLSAEHAARTEGERMARAKDQFLAMLSHELRSPLAAILGWAKVLQRPHIDAATHRRGIEAIAGSARAQARLVDDLLDVSRIVSGKMRMSFEPVELNQVAASAGDAARPAAQDKGVTIELHLADGASTEVTGDKLRLAQVVMNLLNNAVKFTPRGGTVTIATTVQEETVELSVVDTGAGIAADFVPHLFERFSQADRADAHVHGGLGLGLSIVKNLVELHAGTVTASSPGEGQGASFHVRLPRADSAAAPASAPASAAQGRAEHGPQTAKPLASSQHQRLPRKGLRTLFVEDNDYVREQSAWVLKQEGLDVVECASGEEAETEFTRSAFDLVITDVSLPVMSGVDLARRVLAAAPATWVVFATGYPMADKLDQFGPHVRSLPKPFEADDLRQLLDEISRSVAAAT